MKSDHVKHLFFNSIVITRRHRLDMKCIVYVIIDIMIIMIMLTKTLKNLITIIIINIKHGNNLKRFTFPSLSKRSLEIPHT